MKRHLPALAVLLVLSEVVGLLIGHVFFRLFDKTVPPAMLTSFNKGTAHAAFLIYGLGTGLVLFLWGLLAVVGGRLFPKRKT